MDKRLLLCTALFFFATLAHGQNKLSANLETGIGLPFTDLSNTDYLGYRANLMLGAGLGYELKPYSRLRGDLLAGQLNGNDDLSFWQAKVFDGSISYEYNLMGLFNPESDVKLNLRGGLGAGLLNSKRFSRENRQLIVEVPLPPQPSGRDAYSLYTFFLLGANVGIPITNKLDLNLGYAHRGLIAAPWLDAFDENSNDQFGVVTAGLSLYIRTDRDESKIEIDPSEYEALKSRSAAADQTEQELEKEKERLARMEMISQEKEMEIALLKEDIDSLKANPVMVKGEVKPGKGESLRIRRSSVDEDYVKKFRIVVVSAPSQAAAQRFIDRTKLDNTDMVIAYMEQLDTFRVVYKSALTMEEARKYLQEARKYYRDAWVVEF